MEEANLKVEYATKVVISLVKSPIYSESIPNTDEELKSYFKIARKLQINDYFHFKSLRESSKSEFFLRNLNIIRIHLKNSRYLFSVQSGRCRA